MADVALEQERLRGEQIGLRGEQVAHQRECVEYRKRIEGAVGDVAADVTEIKNKMGIWSTAASDVTEIKRVLRGWRGAAWAVAGSAGLMAISLICWMALQIWPPVPRMYQPPVTVYQSQGVPSPLQSRTYATPSR